MMAMQSTREAVALVARLEPNARCVGGRGSQGGLADLLQAGVVEVKAASRTYCRRFFSLPPTAPGSFIGAEYYFRREGLIRLGNRYLTE
jgi:hypothetical protein